MAEEGDENKNAPGLEEEKPKSWLVIFLCICGLVASLYVFIVGVQLLGDAFRCLGGRSAGNMFAAISNPIAGLMTGVLATVMVQSSSTSTSIVVGLVGSGKMDVQAGIPVIMGANIGTSVTNTIVSMGHAGDRLQLERAFAGATVHDIFNCLSALTLLPLELIIAAIQGEGGPLYWLTHVITKAVVGGKRADEVVDSPFITKNHELFDSPVITSPVAALFIKNNKYIIKALPLKPPVEHESGAADTNATNCDARRLAALASEIDAAGNEVDGSDGPRSLLSRRMADDGKADCSHYYCVTRDLDKLFGRISKQAYPTELTPCEDHIIHPKCDAEKELCYLNADKYYKEYVTDSRIIEDGFTKGAGDVGGGILALFFALFFLCVGLSVLCKLLGLLLMAKVKPLIAKATRLPGIFSLVIGLVITIIVQSSSVVTSALTPFCGVGVLPLEKMLPLTLGANMGTTITALITSLESLKFEAAVQIALVHLFFNIIGILIWYPIPPMRRVALSLSKTLGLYASFYRFVPILYIIITFVILPGIALGVSALWDYNLAGGIALLCVLALALIAFIAFWCMKGRFMVLTPDQRLERQKELADDNARIMGKAAPEDTGVSEPTDARV